MLCNNIFFFHKAPALFPRSSHFDIDHLRPFVAAGKPQLLKSEIQCYEGALEEDSPSKRTTCAGKNETSLRGLKFAY